MIVNEGGGGKTLPVLESPGTSDDLAYGKQLIGQNGEVIHGGAHTVHQMMTGIRCNTMSNPSSGTMDYEVEFNPSLFSEDMIPKEPGVDFGLFIGISQGASDMSGSSGITPITVMVGCSLRNGSYELTALVIHGGQVSQGECELTYKGLDGVTNWYILSLIVKSPILTSAYNRAFQLLYLPAY